MPAPPSDPTPRQAEILDHAAELVAAGGLANFTLRRLAERVGFTEPAIYRHFPGKQALLLALIDRLGARLLARVAIIAADRGQEPRARLRRMVRHHVGVLRSTRGLPVLLLAEGLASGNRELVERLGQVMKGYVGQLAAVLEELDLGLPLPAERQAALFLGLPAALGIQLRAFPELAPGEAEADALVDHYVEALTRPARRDAGDWPARQEVP